MASKKRKQSYETPIEEELETTTNQYEFTQASKTTKPLPDGYVCKACGSTGHAIYNCPKKVSKKAKVHKNLGESKEELDSLNQTIETQQSHSLTVYITGLPFDTTQQSLKKLLQPESPNENIDTESSKCRVAFIKLHTFEDNPAKCRGAAIVTLRDSSSLSLALSLNGKNCGAKVLKVELMKQNNGRRKKTSQLESVKRCYRCGEKHDPNTCTNARICYRCRSTDHLSRDCPLRKRIDEA
jgi:hypothetical protein